MCYLYLHFHAPQECQDDRRSQDSPSLPWRGTWSPWRAPPWAANQLPTSGGSVMTRRSKVSMWCGFLRALNPLLLLVPSRRHHYCQVIQQLHSLCSYSCIVPLAGGLAVPWFAWLIASVSAVVGSCPNVAGLWRCCPHFTTWSRWRHIGVPLIDYKVKWASTVFCLHC